MKPSTFVAKLAGIQADILDGWTSGAAFEGYVQVLMDRLVRQHLTAQLRGYENEDGSFDYSQRSGKNATGGPGFVMPTKHWERMREIKYDNSKKISDMRVKVERSAEYEEDGFTDVLIKGTYYWIELKVESPGTASDADFGGKTPAVAIAEDVAKLRAQKLFDEANPPNGCDVGRFRFWYVMLAFSKARRAYLKADSLNVGWTILQQYNHPDGKMVVGLKEL